MIGAVSKTGLYFPTRLSELQRSRAVIGAVRGIAQNESPSEKMLQRSRAVIGAVRRPEARTEREDTSLQRSRAVIGAVSPVPQERSR